MQTTRLFTVLLLFFFVSVKAQSLAAQTISHTPVYTFNGDSSFDSFGTSVSGAGDVNGDGMADLIVGAEADDNNGSTSGRASVLSGSDGSVLFTADGDGVNNRFGTVSDAGDVNGDGTPDLIVGARGEIFDSGYARVLSGIDGSILYNFDGDNPSDGFGVSTSGAGDVNGDGFDDVIVGAWGRTSGAISGYARVLSGIDGNVLYNFVGDSLGDNFGRSVSGAGDVNGDGTPDLIVGAPENDTNGNRSGSARVLSGSDGSVLYTFNGDNAGDGFGVSVSGAGDVDGDGFDDLIVGTWGGTNSIKSGYARVFSGSDGSVLYNFEGDDAGDDFGWSVSGAGDVNGDGLADLIVGAPSDDNNGTNSGNVRVLSGSDGSDLYSFDGDRANRFGWSVSGAGDVNGDGLDDVIAGAFFGGTSNGGFARVFISSVLGDCNLDGVTNFADIAPFISILFTGEYLNQADTDQNGVVNFLDIPSFIKLIML